MTEVNKTTKAPEVNETSVEELVTQVAMEKERLAAEAELKELTKDTKELKKETKEDITEKSPTVTESSTERVYTELEKEQMEKGWDPNHPGGVDAKEFKRVGEIIEAKRKASKEAYTKSKEVEELTKSVKYLVEHNKAVEKAAYDKALRDLYNQKLEKIQEGDVAAVQEIERQQASLKPPVEPEVESPVQTQSTTEDELLKNPDVIAFREEFKSFLSGTSEVDLAVQGYVQAKANKFQSENPNIDPKDAISEIRKGLQTNFPSLFKNPNKDKPAMTESSTTTGTASGTSSVSRLSFEQRAVLAQIQAADPSYKSSEFIKQLELTGKL